MENVQTESTTGSCDCTAGSCHCTTDSGERTPQKVLTATQNKTGGPISIVLDPSHVWHSLRLELEKPWHEQYEVAYRQGWATEPKKIYTKHDSESYGIEIPTIEKLGFLYNTLHLDLRGRIVTVDNSTFDADQHGDVIETLEQCDEKDNLIAKVMGDLYDISEKTASLEANVQISDSICLVISKKYPTGTYNLLSKHSEDRKQFKLCDNEHCLKTCSIALNFGIHDIFRNEEYSESIVDFISTRKMYTLERKEEGSFDLCQLCLVTDVATQLQTRQ